MKEVILSAKDVSKRLSGETVLDHVSAELYQGDFTVIMGASGAGKSTLLYALSGMDAISEGQVFYKGREISGLGEKKMAALRAREFGFVFQQTCLVSNLTLFENVAVAGYLGGSSGKAVRGRAEELLERMRVGNARNRLPGQVSGGEAQRAAIARAVINRPSLLFADEPTGALNRRNTDEVLDLLTGLNREGQSILMVTHDLRCAARGNRILYLEDGKLLDELELPPYGGESGGNREARLGAWLSGLGW